MYIDLQGAIKVLTASYTHLPALDTLPEGKGGSTGFHLAFFLLLFFFFFGFLLLLLFLFISLQNGIFKSVCRGQGTCALFT